MCLLLHLYLLLVVQECSCRRHQYSAVIGAFFDAGRLVPDPSEAGQHRSCKEYQPPALHTSYALAKTRAGKSVLRFPVGEPVIYS